MQLTDYPNAIATIQQEILNLSRQARELKAQLSELDSAIKHKVAFDSDLKNDRQRDACIAEFRNSPSYRSLQADLEVIQDQQAQYEIELERLRGQFTATKLEMRERTALAELQVAFN
ncbi:hypothetical protein [Leptolyngbya sp. FACHB-16]|uniref:hypothetical protein n=1 Tax=unclassified Leptolyngbya TaxID=2650499 RepID=UPI001682F2A9|nr:hypothetical protein [Leptolyngbya sp. FACHB-16]MBD2153155.1 hypothetical protein [Leptolyngbya sp. FACHB-16]